MQLSQLTVDLLRPRGGHELPPHNGTSRETLRPRGGHELPPLNGTSRETFFFKTLHHGVEGEVRIEGDKIVVENFSYDGTAPDAFFYVGTSGCPSGSGTLLGELLGKHSRQRVELELPKNIRAGDLTLVSIASTSVLCR